MSTLRISNIEAKSVPASATTDEKIKITNSSGDVLVFIDGKTSGITTIGINTTDGNIKFDENSNIVVTGIITATKFVGEVEPTDLTVSGKVSVGGSVTAATFYGSGANLTGISAGTSLSGSTNNTVCTVTGANAIQGEANLTFDGSSLDIFNGSNSSLIKLKRHASTATEQAHIGYYSSGLHIETREDTYISLKTNGNEKVRIASDGFVGIGYATPRTVLEVNATHNTTADTVTPVLRLCTGNSYAGNNTGSALEFGTTNTTYPTWVKARIGAVYNGSSNYGGHLVFQTNTGTSATALTEKMRLTDGGNLVQYTNHLSGSSPHQSTGWYGDDANNYTLEYKDFNEIRAVKSVNTSNYSSIVYKREMMTEYCDIEFTLKGSASNSQRHVGFIINGDGSDTLSNFDVLVFRTNTGSPSSNQIRLDKGGGGTGFNETSSNVPSFFDGNERHVHIQIRKRTFSITVNRLGQSEYNFNARNSADLVSSRGYFGFSIYEPSSANPEVTIRDFKITNYTQNAIPSTSVAFQATHSGNPSKSSGYQVKPCNVEIFDNGYGGNYNTSNSVSYTHLTLPTKA